MAEYCPDRQADQLGPFMVLSYTCYHILFRRQQARLRRSERFIRGVDGRLLEVLLRTLRRVGARQPTDESVWHTVGGVVS